MRKKNLVFMVFAILTIAIIVYSKMQFDSKIENEHVQAQEKMESNKEQKISEREAAAKELYNSLPIESLEEVSIKSINTDLIDGLNKAGLADQVKVVFLGDSTTEQNHQTNGDPVHVKIIEDKLKSIYGNNVEFVNKGHSGDSITEMADRIDEVINQKPDLVVINSGLNDVRLYHSNDKFEKTYKAIIETIQKETSADIILRTSNVTKTWDTNNSLESSINPIVKKLSEEYETGYIDLYTYYSNVVGDDIDKYNNDNVHPNGKGQEIIADIVLYTLLK